MPGSVQFSRILHFASVFKLEILFFICWLLLTLLLSCMPESLYHFGDTDRVEWKSAFDLYNFPEYRVPNMEPMISFGLAGRDNNYVLCN